MKKVIFIVEIEKILNKEMYSEYIEQAAGIIKKNDGEYIARSNNIHAFCGDKPERCIVIGFNSMEETENCFQSEEYFKIKPLRENSTISKAFIVVN